MFCIIIKLSKISRRTCQLNRKNKYKKEQQRIALLTIVEIDTKASGVHQPDWFFECTYFSNNNPEAGCVPIVKNLLHLCTLYLAFSTLADRNFDILGGGSSILEILFASATFFNRIPSYFFASAYQQTK